MHLEQKRLSNHARFEFDADFLSYEINDLSGRQAFSVEYGAIPTTLGELEERNPWYRNLGILWGLAAVFLMMETSLAHGLIWMTVSLGCFATYRYARTTYSVIDTERGRIYIIQDRQHDAILQELQARRRAQLRAWYGDIDYDNDPDSEQNKFHWLQQEGVISDAELEEVLEKIKTYHGEQGLSVVSEKQRTIN